MVKKILVIRLSSLGDVLLTTPVLRAVKGQGHEVHFLTKSASAPLLEGNSNIDKIHILKASLKESLTELRAEKFDYIIDLQRNIRSYAIRMRLGKLFCASKAYPKYSFRRWVCINFHNKSVLPKNHVVDRYFKAAKSLGLKKDECGLDLCKIEKVSVVSLERPYIAIAIGSKHYTKQIPSDKIASIVKSSHAPVVFLGDAKDKKKALEIKQLCKDFSFIDLCGQLSLPQTAYIIQQSQRLICGDSLLMHIGAALDKNMTVLWGSTVPEFGMYPYYARDSKAHCYTMQRNDLICRPCHQHGREKCPKGHFDCMNTLDYNSSVLYEN